MKSINPRCRVSSILYLVHLKNKNMIKSYFKEYIVPQNRDFRNHKHEKMEAMIKDKGYVWCEHCFTTRSYMWDYHHIVYRSEKPSHQHLNDKLNLIFLCKPCHEEFHKHKHTMRAKYIIERKLIGLFGSSILSLN